MILSLDTHPDIERMQIERLRQMPAWQVGTGRRYERGRAYPGAGRSAPALPQRHACANAAGGWRTSG